MVLYIIHKTIVYLIKLLNFIKIYKVHRIGICPDFKRRAS